MARSSTEWTRALVDRLRVLAAVEPDRYREVLTVALAGWAERLLARYDQSGDAVGLNEAIAALAEAGSGPTLPGVDRPALLSSLGNALLRRFEQDGEAEDLDHAIASQRVALKLAGPRSRARRSLSVNLGLVLKARSAFTGDLESLDEAIESLRQAAALPDVEGDTAADARCRAHLGAALRARYVRVGRDADLEEAEVLLREALGEVPPGDAEYLSVLADLADVVTDLADVFHDPGRLAEAVDLYRVVLHHRTRLLGPDHPDTVAGRNNLAAVDVRRGDLAGAAELFTTALETTTRTLGADHPDTMRVQANLARVLARSGEPERARELFDSALAKASRLLGTDHPETLTIAVDRLRLIVDREGPTSATAEQARTLLGVQLRVLGLEHPEVLATRALLFATREALDHTQSAEPGSPRTPIPLRRLVLLVDIVDYSRAWVSSTQFAMQHDLDHLLDRALIASGANPHDCVRQSFGDGRMVLMHPGVDEPRLVRELPRRLARQLCLLAERQPSEGRLRLRAALDAGLVVASAYGFSGGTPVCVARMIDSSQVREASRSPRADLVVVLSSEVHDTLLNTAEAGLYRPIEIRVKEFNENGWMRVLPAVDVPTINVP